MQPYSVRFRGDDVGNGKIFCFDGQMFLCGGGVTVKVPASVYHERMRNWIENRAMTPLVFIGDGELRCVMTAIGSGEVEVDLRA